jgi:hypothetical protein
MPCVPTMLNINVDRQLTKKINILTTKSRNCLRLTVALQGSKWHFAYAWGSVLKKIIAQFSQFSSTPPPL